MSSEVNNRKPSANADKKAAYDSRKRANKEAYNKRMHGRLGSKHAKEPPRLEPKGDLKQPIAAPLPRDPVKSFDKQGKSLDGPDIRKALQSHEDSPKPDPMLGAAEAKKLKPPKTYICKEDAEYGLTWNGKNVNDKAMAFTLSQGELLADVIASGPGYATTQEGKGSTELMTSCRSARGFEPLLRRLSTEHAIIREVKQEQQLKNILSLAKTFGEHPDMVSTAMGYIRRAQDVVRETSSQLLLLNGESINLASCAPNLAHYPDTFRNGKPWVVPFARWIDHNRAEPWEVKNIVKSIIHEVDGNREVLREGFTAETIKFERAWVRPRHVTCYFRFSGVNQREFLWYDISSESMEYGVKRILGARDNEDVYVRHEKQLVSAIMSTITFGSWEFQLARKCGMISLCTNQWDQESIGFKVVASFLRIFPPRCNLNFLRKILDSMHSKYDHIRDFLNEGFLNLWSFFGRDMMRSIPHAKSRLRSAYVDGVKIHDRLSNMVKKVAANVKEEPGKPNKRPRLFVSYDAGCMYANHLPELVKLAMNGIHTQYCTINSVRVRFDICILSVNIGEGMSQVFRNVIKVLNSQNHIMSCIFSDDSVLVGNVLEKAFAFNVDISSCDSSNGSPIFHLLGLLLGHFNQEEALGLVGQCCTPIHLANPKTNGERFIISLNRPFEGSGTVLTTCLNNVANALISLAVLHSLDNSLDGLDSLETTIVNGALSVGHKVTTDWAGSGESVVVEKIQFLKYSPLMCDSGEYVPTLNYGCIFRSFGIVVGDLLPEQLGLPAREFNRLTLADRAERFFSRVVAGLVHEPRSRIMDALRRRFNLPCEAVDPKFLMNTTHRGDSVLDEDSICRRYGITSYDVDELVSCIDDLQVGDHIKAHAIGRFYFIDYGLPFI